MSCEIDKIQSIALNGPQQATTMMIFAGGSAGASSTAVSTAVATTVASALASALATVSG